MVNRVIFYCFPIRGTSLSNQHAGSPYGQPACMKKCCRTAIQNNEVKNRILISSVDAGNTHEISRSPFFIKIMRYLYQQPILFIFVRKFSSTMIHKWREETEWSSKRGRAQKILNFYLKLNFFVVHFLLQLFHDKRSNHFRKDSDFL